MGNPSSNLANACVGGSGTVTEAPGDAGGCTVVAHLSGCQVMGSSETLQIDETATWNAGYTMATGTLSVVISGDCSGTYDLTATQQ
jgi:hypothetical protein